MVSLFVLRQKCGGGEFSLSCSREKERGGNPLPLLISREREREGSALPLRGGKGKSPFLSFFEKGVKERELSLCR